MPRTWRQSLSVYLDRRQVLILLLGFASGLPLLLVFSTLSAWLSEEGVSKTTIGAFSLVSSAYALKFLWSPLVDRLPLPPFTNLLGRRRGWLVAAQLATVAGILGMATTSPAESLLATAAWAVVLAFASATQDIVIDALRVEMLEEEEQGAGASMVVFGYRIGMLAAGAGVLILADNVGWSLAYVAMALLMSVGLATAFLCPEPERQLTAESVALEEQAEEFLERRAHLPPPILRVLTWLHGAVICPFAEFMKRPGWLTILAFVALYKYGDALLGVMANPFYLELGFTKTQIGTISKLYGLVMTLLGTFAGGIMVARLGLLRSLLIAGILQALSNLVFAAQAMAGDSVPMLTVTISVENFTGGLGTAAFVAYLSSLCNVAYTATQYALLSSLMSFARTWFSAGGGWLADRVDWVSFFLVTTLAAVPGLVLLLRLMKLHPPEAPGGAGPAEILPEPD